MSSVYDYFDAPNEGDLFNVCICYPPTKKLTSHEFKQLPEFEKLKLDLPDPLYINRYIEEFRRNRFKGTIQIWQMLVVILDENDMIIKRDFCTG